MKDSNIDNVFDYESNISVIDTTLKNFLKDNTQYEDEVIPDYGFNCKAASNLEEDKIFTDPLFKH